MPIIRSPVSYVEDKLVRIEGKVVEFNIRNPHSFINIEVKDKDGKMVRWGGEWGGVTQLSQGGVDRFTPWKSAITSSSMVPRPATHRKRRFWCGAERVRRPKRDPLWDGKDNVQ